MFESLNERFTRIFERPVPVVFCDIEAINASAPPGFFDGYFIVKNIGGGNLEGDIFAQSSFINLLTQTIEGNDVIIEYEIDLTHLNPGDTFLSQIVLTTSGGQLVIPVKISIEPHYIKCGRYKVHSPKDFGNCVRIVPEEAAELFVTEEFEQWLINSEFGHMELYHKMTESSVGVKELDSFLTVCGLKKQAGIVVENNNMEINVLPYEGVVTEQIPLTSASWGFFEYEVQTVSNAPWLKLLKKTVSDSDFDENGFMYPFKIDTRFLYSRNNFETVVFENDQDTVKVNITVLRPKLFTVKPSRLSYRNEDSGYLVCSNYTGRNALVEVNSSENFVRFKASKYVVKDIGEIPFEIKVNSFLNLGIGKKPVNISEVNLRAVIDGKVYKETVTIKAGSLLGV